MRYISVSVKERKKIEAYGFFEESVGGNIVYVKLEKKTGKSAQKEEAIVYYVELKDGKRSYLLECQDQKQKDVNLVFYNFDDLFKKIVNTFGQPNY